jgi:hypothetical protein
MQISRVTGSPLIPFPIPRGYAAEREPRPHSRFSRVLLVNARINALDYIAERSIRRAKITARMPAFSRDRHDARKMLFENSVDPALTRFPWASEKSCGNSRVSPLFYEKENR